MAKKRITTVEEILDIEPDADYLLVSRGVQQDLRRILLRRLPMSFDIHDDVSDELAILAGIDRLLISDESSPGAPQKFVKLSTLRSFFLDLFDLHDDVPTELTEAADNDRLLISDEDEPGNPQKFITVRNFGKKIRTGLLQYEVLAAEYNVGADVFAQDVSHNLGRRPVMVFPVLVCKQAQHGYSAGDEVYVTAWGPAPADGQSRYYTLSIVSASATQVTVAFTGTSSPMKFIYIPNKSTGALASANSNNHWKLKFMVVG